jgi:hypothetical protein
MVEPTKTATPQNEEGGGCFFRILALLVILSRRAARAVSKDLREAISVPETQ